MANKQTETETEACTMNTTKQNKSISARKAIQENVFLLTGKHIEKHMQKFRQF